jgi:hypothetical protein
VLIGRWLLSAAVALLGLSSPSLAQVGIPYGARDPVLCPSLKQAAAPTAQQAALLFRCKQEWVNSGSGELWLIENLQVEVGPAQHFTALSNVMTSANVDTTKPVHVIKGSWTSVVCKSRKDVAIGRGNPDLNCTETPVTSRSGVCWKTNAGEWACLLNGVSGESRVGVRPPR